MAENTQNACRRCGACCIQGGPALHRRDLDLVRSGRIAQNRLVTLRKGELAHNPRTGKVQAVRAELVKIGGSGRDWCCSYYIKADKGCGIYANRPQACEALKCWDTGEILDLVEQDLLSCLDILAVDNPMVPVIMDLERLCPCPDIEGIAAGLYDLSAERKGEVEDMAGRDLRFRTKAIKDHGLLLADELFYFGRPLFQLLQQLGIGVSESRTGVTLHWPS